MNDAPSDEPVLEFYYEAMELPTLGLIFLLGVGSVLLIAMLVKRSRRKQQNG